MAKSPPQTPPPVAPPSDRLTSEDIKTGVAPHKEAASACGPEHGGQPGEKVDVKLEIEGSTGRVVRSHAVDPHTGTPLGRCVAGELAKSEFRTFERERLSVIYPVRMVYGTY